MLVSVRGSDGPRAAVRQEGSLVSWGLELRSFRLVVSGFGQRKQLEEKVRYFTDDVGCKTTASVV